MIRQFELVEKVKSYDPDADEEAINRAYVFAMKAHGSQTRASGDPYFSHPVEVAYLLTGLKLDTSSIVTALLHDTVEDTDATLEDIEGMFGTEVKKLVDGVTKLGKLEFRSETEKQAENFRKLLMALSEDIRVLLVKLADRLHNMRTLHFVKSPEKRQRIAYETLEIYAPLAERIGMRTIKEELQDLAFAELYSEAREGIVKRLTYLREQGHDLLERIQKSLQKTLDDSGVKATIVGREKKPYSIWKKMERKGQTFEQLSDIVAFRVIAASIPDCYHALGAIHAAYHMIPGQFKDYISTPKPNGYQSLHTVVLGPEQFRMEIQIRTYEMHEVGEFGVAAHWSYKQGHDFTTDGKQYRWVRELLEILEKSESPEDLLENTKLEMYHDQVFCFTPKGDIIALPRKATPVDFAYAIHTKIGETCVGAKVNGRIVPLKHQLKNGDQVEVITSKTQVPSPAWERFVVTPKARSEVRRFIRLQKRGEYLNLGRAILAKTFSQEGHEFHDKMIEPALKTLARKTVEDVIAEVGEGLLGRMQVLEAIFPPKKQSSALVSLARFGQKVRKKKTETMPIRGLVPGMALHYARCCHPIPGDRIVGIVTTGKGITIHTLECEALESFADTPERWIDVSWDRKEEETPTHVSRVRVRVSHEVGALAMLTEQLAKDMANITNFKILSRTADYFDILVDVEVKDTRHLGSVIASLRSKSVIQSVERYKD